MRQELWDRRIEAIRAYENSGLAVSEVARQVGLTGHTVRKHAASNGIVFSSPADDREKISIPKQRVILIRELAEEGKTREEVASIVGLKYQTVVCIAIKHEIDFRHANVRDKPNDRAEAIASMFMSGKTLAEIGGVFGVSRERIRQILKRHFGMTSVDGGAKVKADRRNEAAARRKDDIYLKTRGCTYAEYRELVSIGRQIMDAGGTRERTPIGAFASQRANAKVRGIEWSISLWDWWTIWQRSGKWEQRGRCKDNYVMCRFADDGIYEPSNVYIATSTHNVTVQPNNPYRKGHPDHDEAMAKIRHKFSGRRRRNPVRKSKNADLPIGVFPRGKRFTAQISISRKIKFLGTFDTPEQAHQAYLNACEEIELSNAA